MNDMKEAERKEYKEEHRQWIEQLDRNSLNLGLDLQGGMHAALEVQTDNLLKQLATNKDKAFRRALEAARKRAKKEDISVVDAFVQEFQSRNPNGRLSRYYRDDASNITRRSSNEKVQEYLSNKADDAVQQAMEVVRNRVNRYGVTEPTIQKQGERRIVVQLPGVEERQRIRSLLESASQLTFHLMADPQELKASVQRIIEYYEPTAQDTARLADAPAADTVQARADTTDTSAVEEGTRLAGGEQQASDQEGTSITQPGSEESGPQNPLLAVMQPLPRQEAPIVGYVSKQDTARVNELISDPKVQEMIPAGVSFWWSANPVGQSNNTFALLGVQSEPELLGEVITEASVTFSRASNQPMVSMSMNSQGTRQWSRLTAANVGERVAIVLDELVYSYPNIQERIPGGRTQIEGLESRQEASDIVTVLQSGSLPTELKIVEERTVGPSLGEESTRAGLISVVSGFLLVVLFMIMYYRTAGVVADIALLLNLILILGILAGFGATLTLPGIAGIVLTIGMAVDANVLIYDRVREEQATGKTLKAAINAGYEESLSAILDANITTFFVGVILYSFGVGPIRGFAVTLMAGILASLFTAIIVTRIIFDYMVEERQMRVSYG
ncbi:MAG: protein translocase subunit SecD [Salinibacter sp.]|uniref:protein translocase subunit SecD n=1 Tax=Salinibacter sp. TaxID=2065818 RepID=UPI0035D4992D